MKNILLIDDDPVVRSLASGILRKNGYNVQTAKEGREGLEIVKNSLPDLVITDYQMPGLSGMEVLTKLKEVNDSLPVIMLTAFGDATLTIKTMQTGAFDYIEKPINPKELLETVKNGLKASESMQKQDESGSDGKKKKDENLMVGKSPAMLAIFKNIGRISQNYVNILISGESGTGKERLARLIHHTGPDANNHIVFINCKSLTEDGLHQAFKEGVENGTLILDEVGTLTSEMQLKLLDLMENQSQQNGYTQQTQYRIISIARRDISKMAEEGSFLKKLYYQLKVFVFKIPSLEERKDDIPYLVDHMMQELNQELGKTINQIEDGVIPILQSYNWPGNIRELRNVLMQAMVLSHGDMLLKKYVRLEGQDFDELPDYEVSKFEIRPLADVEKEHIGNVLKALKWNKQEASAALGITRPTLNAKIDKYELKRE
jgi:two-component system, NtrC family, response regulator AtoC